MAIEAFVLIRAETGSAFSVAATVCEPARWVYTRVNSAPNRTIWDE